MPLIVDHEERRRAVAQITIDLILRHGVDSVSVRAIARAAGYSTAIVSHYFQSKSGLLLQAYRTTLDASRARVEAALNDKADIITILGHLLPLDAMGRDHWKIWFAFWGMASSDKSFQREQLEQGRAAQNLIARALSEASNIPEKAAGGRTRQAQRLLAMVAGLATQATYDAEAWPPSLQRALLEEELASLAAS